MNTVCVVQARMGSTRLPGKSAMPIAGKPLVWHVLNRIRQVKSIDQIVLAIPNETDHEVLEAIGKNAGVAIMMMLGNPNDLIHRHATVAYMMDADKLVRIPGDNPCVDPDEIERILSIGELNHHLTTNLDRNVLNNGYPGGLGAEVYEPEFLYWLDENVIDSRLREHPHMWAFEKGRIVTCQAPDEINRPMLRFDVNTRDDFDFISDIYQAIYPSNPDFRTKDILAYLDTRQ